MARCRVDKSIERREIDGFAFPLGVYPIEDMTPREGYAVWFEPADGTDSPGEDAPEVPTSPDDSEDGGLAADWEEWPDRYVFDIAISATRVEALSRALFAMMPGRISPILDFLGHDAYREVDPYVSYDLIGQERFIDALRRYRAFFFEDGLVGFGALSEEPFIYVFVDEHKLVTVRVEAVLKEKIESLLAAFDLPQVDEISGADAVTHEHRGVLDAPGRPHRPAHRGGNRRGARRRLGPGPQRRRLQEHRYRGPSPGHHALALHRPLGPLPRRPRRFPRGHPREPFARR